MTTPLQARREAGAAIRRSAPTHQIRFPRLFSATEIGEMPRIAFARGVSAAAFISTERDGARHYSQAISFVAADSDPVVWQATSWDEAFYVVRGRLRLEARDRDGQVLGFDLTEGSCFWAPAGYEYTTTSMGVDAAVHLTTSPQMRSGWRFTGDDETYSDALVALRHPGAMR